MQRIFWILALILAPLIPAQTRLTFDVASIKPSKPVCSAVLSNQWPQAKVISHRASL